MTALYEFLPLLAVALDLLIGDPAWLSHPVQAIGKCATILEKFVRRYAPSISLKLAGSLCVLFLAGLSSFCVLSLLSIKVANFFIALYLGFAGLALRCLLAETRKVQKFLENGQLTQARNALAMLVSRETKHMDEVEIYKTLAETLSENLNDGFIAPFFWFCLGGHAGLWIYKTISTLDSMWGYKSDKYKEFGWFAARADDMMAYIPARITALILCFLGKKEQNFWNIFMRCRRDAHKMDSPNAGWPMAAAAWSIGAGMGGSALYFGKIRIKPQLGPEMPWDAQKISQLSKLVYKSGICCALMGQSILCVVFYVL